MARYIDADKLSIYFDSLAEQAEMEGLNNMAHIYKRCKQLLDDTPTADVVPKSEVAREIFEEIEKIFDGKKYVPYPLDAIAELKKKYTESGDNK